MNYEHIRIRGKTKNFFYTYFQPLTLLIFLFPKILFALNKVCFYLMKSFYFKNKVLGKHNFEPCLWSFESVAVLGHNLHISPVFQESFSTDRHIGIILCYCLSGVKSRIYIEPMLNVYLFRFSINCSEVYKLCKFFCLLK